MSLDVYEVPGYVLVSCGEQSVLVAGKVVQPPGGAPTEITLHNEETETTKVIKSPPPPPDAPEPYIPAKIGTPLPRISTQVFNLAVPGLENQKLKTRIGPAFDTLLACDAFSSFNKLLPGPYVLTVDTRAMAVKAAYRPAIVAQMPFAVLTKDWKFRG